MEGFEVLQGNYDSNNFTVGNALWLQPQIFIGNCVGGGMAYNNSYVFQPLSARNILSGAYVGYWSGQSSANEMSSFAPFALGTYTVLAGDQWGQVVILHFRVTS